MPTACALSTIISSGSAAIASGSKDSAAAVPASVPDSIKASVSFLGIDMVVLRYCLSCLRLDEVVRDLVEEARGREPTLVGADEQGEVLCHVALLDRLHANLLERVGELAELRIVVELGAVGEAARPGEDRGDGIGRGLLAFLMLAVVPCH